MSRIPAFMEQTKPNATGDVAYSVSTSGMGFGRPWNTLIILLFSIIRKPPWEPVPETINTSMQSFHDWLLDRSQEPAQADRLAALVAQSGATGISIDRLRRLGGLSPETLADVLRSLTATGQVEVVKVGGELRWRAVPTCLLPCQYPSRRP